MRIGTVDFVEVAAVTRAMQDFFGPGIVKAAWVDEETADLRRRHKLPWLTDGVLHWDGTQIAVQLVNGRTVIINNSEWAQISKGPAHTA